MIEWKKIHSSAIEKIGFDKQSGCMYIDFNDSKPFYMLKGVSEELFVEFFEAWESEQPMAGNAH